MKTALQESNQSLEPLHLTQILVSYEDAVRLLRIRDTYDWHQRVWQAFAGRDGKTRDFLTRIDRNEEAYQVLVLSRTVPTKPDWCPTHCFGTKVVPHEFFRHSRYHFSLLANPTRKVRSNASGERTKNGRREAITDRGDLIEWMLRKSAAGGFSIDPDNLRTIPRGREFFHKNARSQGMHSAVEFRGQLNVTDAIRFREAAATGIGSAKAFGFGLLVLAPISS